MTSEFCKKRREKGDLRERRNIRAKGKERVKGREEEEKKEEQIVKYRWGDMVQEEKWRAEPGCASGGVPV